MPFMCYSFKRGPTHGVFKFSDEPAEPFDLKAWKEYAGLIHGLARAGHRPGRYLDEVDSHVAVLEGRASFWEPPDREAARKAAAKRFLEKLRTGLAELRQEKAPPGGRG